MLHKLLWFEAAQAPTDIDNILMVEEGGQPAYTKIYGSDAKYSKYLQNLWQNVCTQTRKNVQKLINTVCMFAGYSTNHAGDVYQFIHAKTNQVIYSRDDQ